MPKIAGHGRAEVFSDEDYARLFRHLPKPAHRLILHIARYTGERIGAILQLQVGDVYSATTRSVPRETITFRARSRKASPTGKKRTRQVPVHPLLADALASYQPSNSGWLFPAPRDYQRPMSYQHCYEWFTDALARAGLTHKGFSLHSPRHTFITNLHNQGVSLATIQALTGHRSLEVLRGYIKDDPAQLKAALSRL